MTDRLLRWLVPCALLLSPWTPTLGQDAGALRAGRDLLIEAADFAAALGPAEQVVSISEDGDDPERGQDLMRLAEVRAALGESGVATETYLRAIEALSTANDDIATLAAAYQGLGRTYLDDRYFDEALVAFDEARSLSRRDTGLFNVDQASIIDDMTLAHLGLGETTEARALQTERLQNAIRRFGPDDARVIPYHTHLGDYLDNSRLRRGARAEYERAWTISNAAFGERSAQSLALLRRLAEIDLVLDDNAEIATDLAAALETAENVDPVERARTLITLGDHSLIRTGPEAAAGHYREAWSLLSSNTAIDANSVFANPRPLNFVPPLSPVDRGARRNAWSWGDLALSFDVGADGRASNVEVVEMAPEMDSVARDYSRRLREAFFRPRLVDGVAVGTADVRYNQNFRFYVRD